jgi:hypothetical protein
MPQTKTKAVIIEKFQAERRRLEQNLAGLTPDDLVMPGVVGEWSIKDVLAHLADWEAHMPVWLAAARLGDPVAEIETGLSWKQIDAFNQRIYLRHCDQLLEDVLFYFHDTHRQFMSMVEAMPEDEMLERGRYAFIGKATVYHWLSLYAGHDRWAKTHIHKWKSKKSDRKVKE